MGKNKSFKQLRQQKKNSNKNKNSTKSKHSKQKNQVSQQQKQSQNKSIEIDTINDVKSDIEEKKEDNQQTENQVILGFDNLGNTCYLNTALQTIRQINYFSNFLAENDFSKTLKELFDSKDHVRQEKLNIIFDISQKYQKHLQNGGDAYMCLLNLLEEISSEVQDQDKFQKNFSAIFEDGMYCDQCEQYEHSESCNYIYIKEEIVGIEETSLDAGIINPQSIYYGCVCQQNCSACKQPTLQPKRSLIFAPKFLFFKLIRKENNNQPSKKSKGRKYKQHQQPLQLNNQLIKEEIESQLFSYFLIGFSELYNNHYTYIAKYDHDWNGLPNIGLTCYINSAVQQLKQFYYINRNIFGSSIYAQNFKDLFNHLEYGNQKLVFKIMDTVFEKSKEQQFHNFGGDAYLCIQYFLYQFKECLPDNEKQEFDNNFLLLYTDYLECQMCFEKIQNTNNQITSYQYEEFGYECFSLNEGFSDKGDQMLFENANPNICCSYCKGSGLQVQKSLSINQNEDIIELQIGMIKSGNNSGLTAFQPLNFQQDEIKPESQQHGFDAQKIDQNDCHINNVNNLNENEQQSCVNQSSLDETILEISIIEQGKQLKDNKINLQCGYDSLSQNNIEENPKIKSFLEDQQEIQYKYQMRSFVMKAIEYQAAPNYLIINPNLPELNHAFSGNISNIFELSFHDRSISKYQIIGFCCYNDFKYAYTAKCGDSWIELKKQQAQVVEPNCSNAQYVVLQKII
ncbi:hypothetical protein ABPG72_004565 [Tetrahymena utriculariae]